MLNYLRHCSSKLHYKFVGYVWSFHVYLLASFSLFPRYDFTATDEDIQNIIDDFGGDLTIPENFVQSENTSDIQINEQTTLLCDMLDLTDPIRVLNNMDSSFNSSFNISAQNITDTVHSECSSSEEDNLHTSYLKNVNEKSPDLTTPPYHISQAKVNNESIIETTGLEESISSSGSSSNTSKRSNTSLVSLGENKKFKRRNLNIYYDSKDSIY